MDNNDISNALKLSQQEELCPSDKISDESLPQTNSILQTNNILSSSIPQQQTQFQQNSLVYEKQTQSKNSSNQKTHIQTFSPEQRAHFISFQKALQQQSNMMFLQKQQQKNINNSMNPMIMSLLYKNFFQQIQTQNNLRGNNTDNTANYTFNHNNNFYVQNAMNSYNNFFTYFNERNLVILQKYSSDALKTEYLNLKRIEHDNPQYIKQNLDNFENMIMLPLYQTINRNVMQKREIYIEIYNKYKNAIQTVLKRQKLENIMIQAYGSMMNNFLIDEGDIDICIVPNGKTTEEFSNNLTEIKNEITNKNIGIYLLHHISNRYSLLKMQDKETGLIIDITVHTMLPIYNTKLIRKYSLYDQRFHILGIYVKHWVKRNKITQSTEKFLSSYALLLMIIHFLQNEIKPSVLPVLQKVTNESHNYSYSHSDAIINCNVYFEEDVNKIENYMKIINNNAQNTQRAAELLLKFFEYYAYEYDHSFLISISNSEKKSSSSEHIAFPIEDPFDIEHNPGKSMKLNTAQYDLFMNCMKKEINILLNGDYVAYLNSLNSHNNMHQFNSYNSD